jgi:hypothetical protein
MESLSYSPAPGSFSRRAATFTANLAQAAGTYDLGTATGGDLLVDAYNVAIFVTTAGATFTSVAIQTDQTTPAVFLTAAEGALANLTVNKNLIHAVTIGSFLIKSGSKIRYTIVGATGTGALQVGIVYAPLTAGATLV